MVAYISVTEPTEMPPIEASMTLHPKVSSEATEFSSSRRRSAERGNMASISLSKRGTAALEAGDRDVERLKIFERFPSQVYPSRLFLSTIT